MSKNGAILLGIVVALAGVAIIEVHIEAFLAASRGLLDPLDVRAHNGLVAAERPMSKNGAILLGIVVALTGIVIIGVAFFGKAEGFHAPRWVVGCAGGSFLFFGGWLAALYATGYDPTRDKETLPSAGVQSLVLIPGMLCFAAPFHWIAFGPGPRQFSSSLSVPFLTTRHASSGLSGRVMFGIGAILIDAILVAAVVRLARTGRARRENA